MMPFTLPRWAWTALGSFAAALALIVAIWAIHRDGYKDGKADADKAWAEASAKAVAKDAQARAKADKNAGTRAADFAAQQQIEKEKIDAAVQNGSSPLDAIFGN